MYIVDILYFINKHLLNVNYEVPCINTKREKEK